jgi:23S rRNA pseudouridine2605 synthase
MKTLSYFTNRLNGMNDLQENFVLDLYLNPSNGIRKRYEVVVSRRPTEEILWKAIREINDEGDFLKFEKITQIGRGNMKNLVFEVELAQGKKNEIHRVFEHFGMFVKNLKRTRIGNLTLRGISLGRRKKLTTKGICLLSGRCRLLIHS